VLYFVPKSGVTDIPSTRIGNMAGGYKSDTILCEYGIGLPGLREGEIPVIANTKDVVKVTDSDGVEHTGEVIYNQAGGIAKVLRNGQDITHLGKPWTTVKIRFPDGNGGWNVEDVVDVQNGSLSRSGPNDTCAFWYRGVYWDFCP
jgi:hypothetical protein